MGRRLFAALCHAGWNAAVKRGLDPLATTILMAIGAALVGAGDAAVHGMAGERSLALRDRLGADPHRLFRGADRELCRRRHGPRLSAGARLGAADDRDGGGLPAQRATWALGLARDRGAGRGRSVALAARQPRARQARPPRHRLCAADGGDDLRLHHRRRHRRAHCRQRPCLYRRHVRRHRDCRWRSMRWCGAAPKSFP